MLNTRAEKSIAGFVEMLDELRGRLDGELGELVEAVLDRTGYRASWSPPATRRIWPDWTT